MNLFKEKYIIVELIPTHSSASVGTIAQIQALKLDGIKLIDRFDYRLNENLIENNDLKDLISYDKENFNYVDSHDEIIKTFRKWIGKLPLLIIDNYYTLDYLANIKNKKESVFKYLNLEFSDDVFDKLMKKYELEPSNHLVDLLYESIIKESNNVNNDQNNFQFLFLCL